MRLSKGFTLIELLVVIAIIGILAAIIFPVYARVKDSAYRSSDMSNMNSISTALQLYRVDQGAYPPALLGYATAYQSLSTDFDPTASGANIVPANLVYQADPSSQSDAYLYPKRVASLDTFRPSYDRNTNSSFTQAYWPQGTGARLTLSQDASGYVKRCVDYGDGNGPQLATNYYYDVSGYDVGFVQTPNATSRPEQRYTLFWSTWSVPIACQPETFNSPTPQTAGSSQDDPRQLGYAEPPETTVVTWDSFFRDYDSSGNPTRGGKRDIVLFLGGSAKPMDSVDVSQQAWTIKP